MDPNANITRQRELAKDITILRDDSEGETWEETDPAYLADIASAATELADLVQALDEWRRNGGFDPYDPPKVWLLSIDTKFGTDTSLHATQDAAHETLVGFVRENWPEHGPPEPADDQDAINTYFEYRDATDSYIIDEQEVSQ